MKLVHPEYSFQIEFVEGKATELIIENPHVFTQFVQELLWQLDDNEGRFVLSHNNELLKLNQQMDCIINPFEIDINQKKMITKLYNIIKQEVINSELMYELAEAHHPLVKMLNAIQQRVDYPLTFKEEFDILSLVKYMDVKLVNEKGELIEQIIDYSKILYQLLKQDIIILINIQSYLSEQEIQLLLKHSIYEKIHFLFIENVDREIIRENVRKIIIDSDRCEIY